jgi:hypothetical protein
MGRVITQAEKITMDGVDRSISDTRYIRDCYFDGRFAGTAIARTLEFTALNSVDYRGKEFTYQRGTYTDGDMVYETEGTFIVTDVAPSDTEFTVRVTAYDYMLKMDVDYVPGVEFPCTLQALFSDLVAQTGLPTPDALDINQNFVVVNNQYEFALCREVLRDIAAVTGNFAYIDQEDNLRLMFTSSERVQIPMSEYAELVAKRDETPVTVVSIGLSAVDNSSWAVEWQDGIEEYGFNVYSIWDNFIAWTNDKRSELAPALLEKLKGWSYEGMEMRNCWMQDLRPGQLVSIEGIDGTWHDSVILTQEFTPTTSFMSAQSYVQASISYQKKKDPLKVIGIRIDRNEGEIISLNQSIEEANGTIQDLQTQLVQTKNEFTFTISKSGGINQIRNSAFLSNFDYWDVTGSPAINTSTQAEQTTDSGTILNVASGSTLVQVLNLIALDVYTFVARITKTSGTATIRAYTGAYGYIELYGGQTLNNQEYSFTFSPQIYNPTLIIDSMSDTLAVADMRIVKGDQPQGWSQHESELYGRGILLDNRGVTVKDLGGTGTSANMDQNSFQVLRNGVVVTDLSDYGLNTADAVLTNSLRMGNVKFIVNQDGSVNIISD